MQIIFVLFAIVINLWLVREIDWKVFREGEKTAVGGG